MYDISTRFMWVNPINPKQSNNPNNRYSPNCVISIRTVGERESMRHIYKYIYIYYT